METNKKFGALSSSSNPEELSQTIASAVQIVGLVLGGVAALKGIDLSISNDQMKQVADMLTLVVTSSFAIYHAGQFLLGFFKKVVLSFHK